MLAARAVLHQAHHQAIALIGVDDNGRYGILLKLHERLKPPLATDEVIFRRICPGALRHGDWSLQTNLCYVLDHFFESAPVAYTGIENANSVGGDESDLFLGNVLGIVGHQAASVIRARPASA